jgi:dTDP-4-dehydrorhamnose reductase
MRITVLGANGMAGHVVASYLRQQGHKVDAVDRTRVDVENPISVMAFFDQIDTDFVINCIGLLVQPCIQRPDRASIINSWFPHYIEYCLKDTKTRLIHLSTDCVFDGIKGHYIETDPHTESNTYGRSKSLGEVNNNKDITFRMSIIGPELKNGTGLLDWVRKNSSNDLPGWDNAWWNGVTTLQLAKCIDQYIQDPTISGVYHVVNNIVNINKYELLCLINEVYGLGKTITRSSGPKSINKILVNTRKEFNFVIPDYCTQLDELRNFDPVTHVSPTTSRP